MFETVLNSFSFYDPLNDSNVVKWLEIQMSDLMSSLIGNSQGWFTSKTIPLRDSHTFTPLKALWWTSLVMGVLGQRTNPFPKNFSLTNLDGNNGFAIFGATQGEKAGSTVNFAGDFNRDGFDDILIGARHASVLNKQEAGKAYLIFGNSKIGLRNPLELKDLMSPEGIIFYGENGGDCLGTSVAGAGDVNGDGYDDIMIGAEKASPSNRVAAGKTYVIFGKKNFITNSIDVSNLDGTNGFVINGVDAGDRSGFSVFTAGDVNGDGFDDILIAGYSTGKIFCVFGADKIGQSGSLELNSLTGANGFVLSGDTGHSRSGVSISYAGDTNGDGYDDILIGLIYAGHGNLIAVGKSYVIFGSERIGSTGLIQLNELNGKNGFVLIGEYGSDNSGTVSYAGDVNRDGFADILLSASSASPFGRALAGKSYVIFGNRNLGSNSTINLNDLSGDFSISLLGNDPGSFSGSSNSYAGDINHDGFDDFMIGQTGDKSKVHIIFGDKNIGKVSTLQLKDVAGDVGLTIYGKAEGSFRVKYISNAGDMNGDGVDDIVIGYNEATIRGLEKVGKAYVVFGRKSTALETTSSDQYVPTLPQTLNTVHITSSLHTKTLITSKASGPTTTSFASQILSNNIFISSATILGASKNQPISGQSLPLILGLSIGGVFISLGICGSIVCWRMIGSKNADNGKEDFIDEGNPMYQQLSLAPIQGDRTNSGYVNPDISNYKHYADLPSTSKEYDSSHYVDVDVVERQHDEYVLEKEDQQKSRFQALPNY